MSQLLNAKRPTEININKKCFCMLDFIGLGFCLILNVSYFIKNICLFFHWPSAWLSKTLHKKTVTRLLRFVKVMMIRH